ncbi:hypothetical protein AVEN_212804-1 [Araneus ventricosus]|uniref:Uncharacterized protein n=1 Tax=Araneus ventricosus TaxID=182803 RepID=A0A4Y2L0D0_ARAVE|nr:hypothetical protein AVEN_212804-1 [Araneus ventricosus]
MAIQRSKKEVEPRWRFSAPRKFVEKEVEPRWRFSPPRKFAKKEVEPKWRFSAPRKFAKTIKASSGVCITEKYPIYNVDNNKLHAVHLNL